VLSFIRIQLYYSVIHLLD